jgi:DNA (cytosine-5)-methyltransferase 1
LSVQEYARIQEFPDDWIFCGSVLDKYKQIGNAVPVGLGKAIGTVIKNHLRGVVKHPPKGFPFSRYKNTDDVSWEVATINLMQSEFCDGTNGGAKKMRRSNQLSLFQATTVND